MQILTPALNKLLSRRTRFMKTNKGRKKNSRLYLIIVKLHPFETDRGQRLTFYLESGLKEMSDPRVLGKCRNVEISSMILKSKYTPHIVLSL